MEGLLPILLSEQSPPEFSELVFRFFDLFEVTMPMSVHFWVLDREAKRGTLRFDLLVLFPLVWPLTSLRYSLLSEALLLFDIRNIASGSLIAPYEPNLAGTFRLNLELLSHLLSDTIPIVSMIIWPSLSSSRSYSLSNFWSSPELLGCSNDMEDPDFCSLFLLDPEFDSLLLVLLVIDGILRSVEFEVDCLLARLL